MKVAILAGLLGAAATSPSAHVLSVDIPEPIRIQQGGRGEARIQLLVDKGFHIQANPAADEFLIPTTVKLDAAFGLSPGDSVYPKGKSYRLESSKRDLLVYDGNFPVRIPLSASLNAEVGDHTLTGSIRYQACDAKKCLFPKTLPFELPVEITKKR